MAESIRYGVRTGNRASVQSETQVNAEQVVRKQTFGRFCGPERARAIAEEAGHGKTEAGIFAQTASRQTRINQDETVSVAVERRRLK